MSPSLHVQLSVVMETLVHAAVAELKKLMEENKDQNQDQDQDRPPQLSLGETQGQERTVRGGGLTDTSF